MYSYEGKLLKNKKSNIIYKGKDKQIQFFLNNLSKTKILG